MAHDDDGDAITFEVGPDIRDVKDAAVRAFDDALETAGTGEVMHLFDPQRINAFSSGGPPVWSVAAVPVDGDCIYLTYGLSEAVDPSRVGCGFELSIRVPGNAATWPVLLLRSLARYIVESGRELEVGQYMPLGKPITKLAHPDEHDRHPDTAMDSVFFVADPTLKAIAAGDGLVEVRRVVGLHADELELLELTTTAGYLEAVGGRDPLLRCDIARATLASDAAVVAAIEETSRQHGSGFSFVAVPGVHWTHAGDSVEVTFPGGVHARRIHRMLRARLPFGRHLLVQDDNPVNELAVAFEPSDQLGLRQEGQVLVLAWSAEHESLDTLRDAGPDPVIWEL